MYSHKRGCAFICEGETEKYFYLTLVEYLCEKYNVKFNIETHEKLGEIYIINNEKNSYCICFNNVGTITQIVNSENWFKNICLKAFDNMDSWSVVLCYDTDSYSNDISKFYEGDWKLLRQNLKNNPHVEIFDMASSADIEDIFLLDLEGISKFLNLDYILNDNNIPTGRKGKSRLKKLFRNFGQYYHEGERAYPLIKSLNLQKIICDSSVPLYKLEQLFFKCAEL